MAKLLLDTNVLINLIRNNSKGKQIQEFISTRENPQIFISVATIAETESLVVQWGWGEQKVASLKKLIDRLVCIDILQEESEMIAAYVGIDAYSQGKVTSPSGTLLKNTARNMGKNDLWIAATTYVLTAELLTMDGDFDHLNGTWFPVIKF